MSNINFIVKNDIELKGNLIFEGATRDNYETTLTITDPTADRTITFPNSTGTVALTSDIPSLTGYLLSSTAASTYQPIGSYLVSADLTGYLLSSTASTTYQPKDQDLTDIAALTGNGTLKKTAGIWGMDTSTYLTSYTETDPIFVAHAAYNVTGTKITNWDTAYTDRNKWDGGSTGLNAATGRTSLGLGTMATEATASYLTSSGIALAYQPLDADLTAIAALAGTSGILKKTAADTWSLDTSTYLTGSNVLYVGTTSIALNRSSASQSLTGITSIDGSAASLTTSRTLWGQSFNGTADITGNLTSVGNITGTGAVTIQSGGTNNNMTVSAIGTGNIYLDAASSSGAVYIGSTATWTYIKNLAVAGSIQAATINTSSSYGSTTASPNVSIGSANQVGTAVTGSLTLKSGNASGNSSGNISIDSGTASTTAGTISIGTTNSPTINIGRTGSTTTINGTFNTTAINGTTIPSSKTLVVTTDAGSVFQAYDADLASIAALTGTSGFLTTNGSGTWTVDTNTYALNSALSSYAALSGATFTGNIAVNNSTSTAITTTGTTAAVFNTNATTLNIGGAATTISIGDTAHSGTTTINNNLAVYGSITFSQGASSLSATTIQIEDTLISLADNNTADILDIGFYAGYQPASTALHTGLARDASDSKWKLFSGVSVQPTATIDFTGATYDTLKIGILEVTDSSTTRTNLGLAIGTNVQAYSATLAGINTLGSGTGLLKNTAGTWSYDNSTYLTTTSASSTYAPIASPTFTGTVTIPLGASIAGYLTTSTASSTYQPLDADLTAIAALTGTSGILKKTAADTWALDTSTYLTSAVTSITAGTGLSGGTITSTGTIALATAYGDTTNPYASKTANYVLASPTGTAGVPTFRALLAADIPTLNQNTTGSAATLTTPRAIYGNNFDGSAALTQVIGATYGGTGNGFTAFTGPTTSTKTFTLPNATATILTDNAAVTLTQGGTNASLTASNGGIVYSTASAMAILSGTATAGKHLQSGPSTAPSWTTATFPSTATTSGTFLTADGTNWVASTQTLTLSGNTTIGSTTNTVAIATSGNTSVTLPTSGTLAILGNNTFTGSQTLRAGTATAGTAPLYFTSGINLTTAAAGAMEFDGTNLYFSPSTTRKTIAFTDSTMTSTTYVGTTSIALNRSSASQSLTGITSIDGSAATLTTPRAIYGNNFDGSAALTGIIASTYGGTGNGFTKFAGPTTAERTFTLPNADATILTSSAAVTATQGGTGQSSWTKGDLLYASATNTLSKLAIAATNGYVLTYNSTSGLPEWAAAAGGTSYIGTTATQASSATQALTGISSITGASTLTLNSTTTSAITLDSTTTGAVNVGTSANAKAITIGNNTTTSTVNVNTGNITNSATLGGGLDINDTVNIHNATTTITATTATSIFTDVTAYSTIEYTIQAKVGSNYRSSKIMLVCNGTSTTSFTEYAILENSVNSIPVTFTAVATAGVVTLRGAFTGWTTGNNITVKVVRTGIV